MNKTSIEWVRNPDGSQGYTWNPITGCLNHVNGLCKGGGFPCYAYKLAYGRLKSRYQANQNIATVFAEGGEPYHKVDKAIATIEPFFPRFWPERLHNGLVELTAAKTPRGVFLCDMGDLFGPWVPAKWIEDILTCLTYHPHDRFYLLTKQPQELVKWSPFPENCWVGVTATNQESLVDALMELAKVDAKVKYLSFEPLLEPMNGGECEGERLDGLKEAGIDWLILGAQTKPYKPPKIEWVREIVEAAGKAGVPVFLKDNMKQLIYDEQALELCTGVIHGESEFDGLELKLRQEIPG